MGISSCVSYAGTGSRGGPGRGGFVAPLETESKGDSKEEEEDRASLVLGPAGKPTSDLGD